jgi:hypothetical protein
MKTEVGSPLHTPNWAVDALVIQYEGSTARELRNRKQILQRLHKCPALPKSRSDRSWRQGRRGASLRHLSPQQPTLTLHQTRVPRFRPAVRSSFVVHTIADSLSLVHSTRPLLLRSLRRFLLDGKPLSREEPRVLHTHFLHRSITALRLSEERIVVERPRGVNL